MIFSENLDSDVTEKKFKETQKELMEKPQKSLFNNLATTVIAGIAVVGVFFVFLWIMNVIRY